MLFHENYPHNILFVTSSVSIFKCHSTSGSIDTYCCKYLTNNSVQVPKILRNHEFYVFCFYVHLCGISAIKFSVKIPLWNFTEICVSGRWRMERKKRRDVIIVLLFCKTQATKISVFSDNFTVKAPYLGNKVSNRVE